MPKQLSIIIVNYKSSQYILDCLQSADANLFDNDAIEWIVVDNDSKDNSQVIITAQFPFVRWFNMGYNAGFARANNQGIKMAEANIVLLLNPDTLLLPGAIETCLHNFVHSAHVACGVQLVHADRSPQFSGSYFMLGGINHLLALPYWGALLKRFASVLKTNKPAVLNAGHEQVIDWISGAFLMVKKSAIEQAGLMDEDFFLYGEEVEWCSRLQKAGSLCLYGNINIIHLIGGTIQSATASKDNSYTNLSDKKGLQLMISNHLRIRKQYGLFWFFFQLLNYTWAALFAFFASFFYNLIRFNNPFTEFVSLFGLLQNVFKLWTIAPKIMSGKKHFYKYI